MRRELKHCSGTNCEYIQCTCTSCTLLAIMFEISFNKSSVAFVKMVLGAKFLFFSFFLKPFWKMLREQKLKITSKAFPKRAVLKTEHCVAFIVPQQKIPLFVTHEQPKILDFIFVIISLILFLVCCIRILFFILKN